MRIQTFSLHFCFLFAIVNIAVVNITVMLFLSTQTLFLKDRFIEFEMLDWS